MKRRLALLLALFAGFAGLSALLAVTGVNCPVRWLTGFSCPGCGMTRACLALLAGPGGLGTRLGRAWRYHPMVFVVVPFILYAVLGKRPLFGGPKRTVAAVCAVCALMLVTYAARLALHDPVLSMEWADGQLARALAALGR